MYEINRLSGVIRSCILAAGALLVTTKLGHLGRVREMQYVS